MMEFGGIDVLQNAWIFAGVWLVALILAAVLRARQKHAPATLLILPILLVAHLGGWFDLTTLWRREGLPIWGGVLLYGFACFCYALWCGWQEIEVNRRERARIQRAWFREHGLPYQEGSPSIPVERRDELKGSYAELEAHNPVFGREYVDDWYNTHKMQLFWWAYLCPVDFVLNVWDKHLKELFLWVLGWPILRYPFDAVSAYHFDQYDQEFRRLLVPAEATNKA